MKKISIVGAGRVGETTAHMLAIRELAHNVSLLDLREGAAEGAALDIQESATLLGFDTRVTGSTQPEILKDSDIVIITAGLPRKPGMSRSDVLDANLSIITSIVNDVSKITPDAIMIVVSNPVDIMAHQAWKVSNFDKRRVIGLSGALDAARMAAFIAMETGFSAQDITTMVLGGHGDSMVPLPRYTCIRGIPLENFLDEKSIDRIVDRTRNGGAEILSLKKTSSAYGAPAAAITEMVDAIVHNRKSIIPCVAILNGEYGQKDIAMGVPAVLGEEGLERIIELPLTPEETAAFQNSVKAVQADLERIG
jgi:malate dehydrogenase